MSYRTKQRSGLFKSERSNSYFEGGAAEQDEENQRLMDENQQTNGDTPETDGIIEMDPEDEMWKTQWNEDQIVWDNGHILWINKNAPERKGKPHI